VATCKQLCFLRLTRNFCFSCKICTQMRFSYTRCRCMHGCSVWAVVRCQRKSDVDRTAE
jgi:hypothetical protein